MSDDRGCTSVRQNACYDLVTYHHFEIVDGELVQAPNPFLGGYVCDYCQARLDAQGDPS